MVGFSNRHWDLSWYTVSNSKMVTLERSKAYPWNPADYFIFEERNIELVLCEDKSRLVDERPVSEGSGNRSKSSISDTTNLRPLRMRMLPLHYFWRADQKLTHRAINFHCITGKLTSKNPQTLMKQYPESWGPAEFYQNTFWENLDH